MGNEKRLLILDDEPEVAKTIALIAKRIGFGVEQCYDPATFFRLLDAWQPSHLALDLVMPAMDGMEVLRRLALIDCRINIILTSGIGSRVLESASRSAQNHGLNIVGTLPKPFRPALLRELLLLPSPKMGGSAMATKSPDVPILPEDILQALADDQFELYYQPKVDFSSRKVIAFEALIRWNHPVYGLLCPDLFIPLSEHAGSIDAITCAVIEMGLDWLQEARKDHSIKLQINISASSLNDISLADDLASRCDSRNLDRAALGIEITESSAMEDDKIGTDILTRLRIKGFELAIDDFGTGYSSMSQLSNLPFSELKIDKSFVIPLQTSSEARKIVLATVKLAQSLGITTVAEGVEDGSTMQFLQKIGCDLAQGYYIAPPMRGPDAVRWLAHTGL